MESQKQPCIFNFGSTWTPLLLDSRIFLMHRTWDKHTQTDKKLGGSHSWAPEAESIQLIRTFSYDLNLQIVNMVTKLNQPLVKDTLKLNETSEKKSNSRYLSHCVNRTLASMHVFRHHWDQTDTFNVIKNWSPFLLHKTREERKIWPVSKRRLFVFQS